MTLPQSPSPDGGQLPGPADPTQATLASPRARTHPITPVIQAFGTLWLLVVMLAIFSDGVLSDLSSFGPGAAIVAVIAALIALLAISAGLYFLQWQRTEYYFDASGDLRLDSGVLFRKERRIALSRLQSVDVVRPLLGRIFGMAALRVEVAGGGDSRVTIEYLSEAHAAQLRAGIIARAAGVRHDAGEAPERVLACVPTKDLVVSLLLRSETVMLTLLTLILVAGAVWGQGAAGLLVILVTGGLPILAVAGQFTRFFNFTVAESPDGLRLRFGLLRTEAQTVPPGRVQAIEVVEPLLWRRRGWVRIRLNVAGQQDSEDGSPSERVLLPVATQEVASQIVALVMPGFAMVNGLPAGVDLQPPPARARKRAWLQYSNLAVGAGDQMFVSRRGFLTRRTALIAHARTQSVRVTQGPWQRALQLASVHVDSTPGPVAITGLHQDARRARLIAEEQLERAARARAVGPPSRWLAGNAQESLEPPAPLGNDDNHGSEKGNATYHRPVVND